MILFKKIYGLLLGIIACVVVFQMASTARFFGVFINRFFPCIENPASSFPCYGIYDIAVMVLAFVIGLILIGIVIFRLIRRRLVAFLSLSALVIVAVAAVFVFYPKPISKVPAVEATSIPSIAITSTTPVSASGTDMLFAATEGAIFSYDVRTAAARQIVSVSYPDVTLGAATRINSTTLGFAVSYPQGNNGPAMTVYTVALNSGALTKLVNIPDVGYFNFISPIAFAYARPDDPNVGFAMNSDAVFLFQNGTSTPIGHLADSIPEGSTLVSSPDSRHLFFANEIYDMQAKTWQAIPKGCVGNRAAWLGDDTLVLRTIRDDSGRGMLCYYNLHTGADTAIGGEQGFTVVGSRIFYETPPGGTDMDSPTQIRVYDPATKTDTPFIADASLVSFDTSIGDTSWFSYQPMERNPQECEAIGCIGGIASGSPMLMDIQNPSAPPIPVMLPTGTSAFSFF